MGMILLVTPSERAANCAAALHEATGEPVIVAESLARATTFLRSESYLAVVLDQYLVETETIDARVALEHLGTAIPAQVNLAISGMPRLVSEVCAAVKRRRLEEEQARRAAILQLQSELNGTITALLLSVGLALETPGLPAAAAEKLQTVHELVQGLRRQLESESPVAAIEPAGACASGSG